MTKIDAAGNLHNATDGRFAGHVLTESSVTLAEHPGLRVVELEALRSAAESVAIEVARRLGEPGQGIEEVFEPVTDDPWLEVLDQPFGAASPQMVAVVAADYINKQFGPDNQHWYGPLIRPTINSDNPILVELSFTDRYAQPELDAEQREYLNGSSGTFDDGYDEADIDRFAYAMSGAVELRCVWEYTDAHGMGGDSEIIGRVPGGMWRPLSEEMAEFLSNHNRQAAAPDNMLADERYVADFDLDDDGWTDGSNVAPEKRLSTGGILR